MNVELQQTARPARMTGSQFRAFQEDRPGHERWELIAGIPMMMTPPKLAHNVIAGNLQHLLTTALAAHDRQCLAVQRVGIELVGIDDYKPEPDVAVIDANYDADQRYVDRVYLIAEIVSSTDEDIVDDKGTKRVDDKRGKYLLHQPCEAILVVQQERIEVHIDMRREKEWSSQTLGADDIIDLPSFGLRCKVSALYENTPLQPRPLPQP